MKTLSEKQKEIDGDGGEQSSHERKVELLMRRRVAFVEAVEAREIPARKGEEDYQAFRHALRGRMKTDRSGTAPRLLQVACDFCKTPLLDVHPGAQLSSDPPQFRVGCVGCGCTANVQDRGDIRHPAPFPKLDDE